MDTDGWIIVQARIVGNLDDYEHAYDWDGKAFPTKELAIKHGFTLARSDDFNIGQVRNRELVWWGWMGEQHPDEDRRRVAYAIGLGA